MAKATIEEFNASNIESSRSSQLLPSAYGTLMGFKAVSYSVSQALSDLIDNSIDAKAETIVIQFGRTNDELKFIQVIDNGEGITPNHIDTAMGWGYESNKNVKSLGCFGLGMKLAAFAIGDSLTVFSKANNKNPVGRRWTFENIAKEDEEWTLEEIDSEIAKKWLARDYGEIDISKQGTLVQLDNIQEFNVGAGQVNETLQTIIKDLKFHVGLHFHRFIESKKFKIYITVVNIENGNSLGYDQIHPMNPMPKKTGHVSYPKTFTYQFENIAKLNIKSYIWPKNSRDPEYKMNGTAVTSQGFYWYRNDRLISHSGWNTLLDNDSHRSLARASIDLPPELDSIFGLAVGKYKVEPPKLFLNNVMDKAIAKDKTVLRQFPKDANEGTYRKKTQNNVPDVTYIPTDGFGSKGLQKTYLTLFSEAGKDVVSVSCVLENLDEGIFFEIDIDEFKISLNKKWLKLMVKDESLSTLKLSIFLLTRKYFSLTGLKKNHRLELEELNNYFLGSVKG